MFAGGDEVQCRAEQGPGHELASLERAVEVLRVERANARRERHRQCRPVLGLQRADRLHGLRQRRVEGLEQPLAGEQRAVELTQGQSRLPAR